MPDKRATHLVIRAERLVDGLGGPPKRGAAVLVEGGKIVRVGRPQDMAVPDGATVEAVEFRGATLLPGLVDAHTHTSMPGDTTSVDDLHKEIDDIHLLQGVQNARAALETGVTTLRDNGGWNKVVFSLKEGIRRGLVPGPRIVASGRPVTMTGGHCWMMGSEADGIEGVRRAVRQLCFEGADFIKVMTTGGTTRGSDPSRPSFTLDEVKAAVDEAHRRGRLVGAHAIAQRGIENCLDAGVDMLIHCTFLQPDGTIKYDPKLGERIAASRAWVNPTLHIRGAIIERLRQKKEEHGLTPEEEQALKTEEAGYERRLEVCRRLVQDGARVIAGSDCGWGAYPFGQFHKEMRALTQAGMTPGQAVVAGTREAAESLGVLGQAGTVEAGKEADMLVVEGDPTKDIMALSKVVAVFKGGARVR